MPTPRNQRSHRRPTLCWAMRVQWMGDELSVKTYRITSFATNPRCGTRMAHGASGNGYSVSSHWPAHKLHYFRTEEEMTQAVEKMKLIWETHNKRVKKALKELRFATDVRHNALQTYVVDSSLIYYEIVEEL